MLVNLLLLGRARKSGAGQRLKTHKDDYPATRSETKITPSRFYRQPALTLDSQTPLNIYKGSEPHAGAAEAPIFRHFLNLMFKLVCTYFYS